MCLLPGQIMFRYALCSGPLFLRLVLLMLYCLLLSSGDGFPDESSLSYRLAYRTLPILAVRRLNCALVSQFLP